MTQLLQIVLMTSLIGLEDICRRGEKGLLNNIFKTCDESESESESNSIQSDEDGKPREPFEAADQCIGIVGDSTLTEFRSSRSGIILNLYQEREKGIAFQLWPAAALLCAYIDENTDILTPYQTKKESDGPIIELGAGVGLCGLYVAAYGCDRVIITDLDVALPLIERNIDENKSVLRGDGSVRAYELKWGCMEDIDTLFSQMTYSRTSSGTPPLVIAADCVYWESLFLPFHQTLCALVLGFGCVVLISHVKRWKRDEKFFAMCRKRMKVEVVKETIEYVKEENSRSDRRRRQISRIYKITCK